MKHSERCAQEYVRTNSRDAAFSRLRIPHPGLRKQFYGLKGRTSLVVTDGQLDALWAQSAAWSSLRTRRAPSGPKLLDWRDELSAARNGIIPRPILLTPG